MALVDILYSRGSVFSYLGKYEDAIKELEGALFFATEGIDIVNIYLMIANVKRISGDIQGGIDEIDMAVSYMSELGLSSKDYVWNSSIAEFYEKIGELGASRYYWQKAYRHAGHYYGDKCAQAGNMCRKLADVNGELEDYNTAIGFYNKYIHYGYEGVTESDINDAMMDLVACLRRIDKFSDILKVYSDMPSEYRIAEIKTSAEVFNFYINIAFAAYNIHEYDIALTVLTKMLPEFDEEAIELDSVKFLLLVCNMRTGNLAVAKSWALEITDILLEREKDGCIDDNTDAQRHIHNMLETIKKCEYREIKWEDTPYATRNVCKEWIEECDYSTAIYTYFRLANYRSEKDSNIGERRHSPTSTFVGADIIAKQNEIIDGWQNY